MNTDTHVLPAAVENPEVEVLRRKLELSNSLVRELLRDKEILKHRSPDISLLFMGVAGNA